MKIEEGKRIVMLLNWVFGGGAVLVLLAKLARLHIAIVDHAGGNLDLFTDLFTYSTTWLVDYSAGYVRRGLCGTIVRWLYLQFGIQPQWTITCVAIACFAALIALAYCVFAKRDLCWWPLALTVCLGGFEMADRDGLSMLLVIFTFWLAGNVKSVPLRYVLINLVGLIAVHVHEMSFFAMMPLLCGLALFDKDVIIKPIARPIVLLPIVIAFCCVALNKGSLEMAKQVSSNWYAILPSWWNGAELLGIRWDIGTSAHYVLRVFRNAMLGAWHHIPHYLLFTCEVGAAFLVVVKLPFCRSSDGLGPRIVPLLLLLQLCSIVVVFPFFFDYSRLFGYWTFSALMCYVLVPRERWSGIFESCANSPFCKILRGGASMASYSQLARGCPRTFCRDVRGQFLAQTIFVPFCRRPIFLRSRVGCLSREGGLACLVAYAGVKKLKV